MPASPRLVFLLAPAVVLLLASFAGPAAAVVSGKYGGGGMVIIRHAPGTTRVVVGAAGGRTNNQWNYRRVEDEVAPEFGGMLATDNHQIGYDAINNPNRQACGNNCAAGGPYTQPQRRRPCYYRNYCRGG